MSAAPLAGAEPPPLVPARGAATLLDGRSGALIRGMLAVLAALMVGALLILATGRDPLAAYAALFGGAFGSPDRISFALNKATPYILTGVGVALCFRAKVINIGGEGQIALGGLAAAFVALKGAGLPGPLLIPAAMAAGMVAGGLWAGLAAAIRLSRGVHEVLCTLLLNFVALLIVAEALTGSIGEHDAGFPQTPMLTSAAWLPRLPGTTLHLGIGVATIAAAAGVLYLWRTTSGFRLRVAGASRPAAIYAGVPYGRTVMSVMLISGALAGLAGSIEVLGVHRRLIEGFSTGIGFTGVGIALLASSNPLAVLPAGILFGLLEAGALSMQRQVGVPSSLVPILQGLSMVFVLCAMGPAGEGRARLMDLAVATEIALSSIRIATPLLLAAFGGILSERAGTFAVAIEGMMLAGALGAAIATMSTGSPALGLLAAAAAGCAVALVVAVATTRFGTDHMVTGLAVNILAAGLTSFALRALFGGRAPVIRLPLLQPWSVPWLSELPFVGQVLFSQPPLTYLAFGLIAPLAFALRRSRAGLLLRAAGENPSAVFAAGADPLRIRTRAILGCGAFAGLGGAALVLQQVGSFTDGMTHGRGFIALAALIVGRWTPLPVAFACLAFGLVSAVALRAQGWGLPVSSYVVQMMPYGLALIGLAGIGRAARLPAAIGMPFRRP